MYNFYANKELAGGVSYNSMLSIIFVGEPFHFIEMFGQFNAYFHELYEGCMDFIAGEEPKKKGFTSEKWHSFNDIATGDCVRRFVFCSEFLFLVSIYVVKRNLGFSLHYCCMHMKD